MVDIVVAAAAVVVDSAEMTCERRLTSVDGILCWPNLFNQVCFFHFIFLLFIFPSFSAFC